MQTALATSVAQAFPLSAGQLIELFGFPEGFVGHD
jgi:hypothetical protein